VSGKTCSRLHHYLAELKHRHLPVTPPIIIEIKLQQQVRPNTTTGCIKSILQTHGVLGHALFARLLGIDVPIKGNQFNMTIRSVLV
jgi:hypothetical protein